MNITRVDSCFELPKMSAQLRPFSASRLGSSAHQNNVSMPISHVGPLLCRFIMTYC